MQMETEPVVASEPMFSAGPSAQVAGHIPAVPNGSSTQAKPDVGSGKMTAEQLAAIEDEELLDKMVLHTQVIILDDFDFVTNTAASVMQNVCVLTQIWQAI